MRLWHQELISKLPRQQLLGQHREIAALRGNGWGKACYSQLCFRPFSLQIVSISLSCFERNGETGISS